MAAPIGPTEGELIRRALDALNRGEDVTGALKAFSHTSSSKAIDVFARALETNEGLIQPTDRTALSKIYRSPELSDSYRERIFSVCIKSHLVPLTSTAYGSLGTPSLSAAPPESPHTTALVIDVTDPNEKEFLLDALDAIPELGGQNVHNQEMITSLLGICRQAKPLLERTSDAELRQKIIRTLYFSSPDQRENCIKVLTQIVQSPSKDKRALIIAIELLPTTDKLSAFFDKASKIIDIFYPVLADGSGIHPSVGNLDIFNQLLSGLEDLSTLDFTKLKTQIDSLGELLPPSKKDSIIAKLLDLPLSKIPGACNSFCEYLPKLLSEADEEHQILTLNYLLKISPESWGISSRVIAPLANFCRDIYDCQFLIGEFSSVDEANTDLSIEERNLAFEALSRDLLEIIPHLKGSLTILTNLFDFIKLKGYSTEDRGRILKAARYFFEGMDGRAQLANMATFRWFIEKHYPTGVPENLPSLFESLFNGISTPLERQILLSALYRESRNLLAVASHAAPWMVGIPDAAGRFNTLEYFESITRLGDVFLAGSRGPLPRLGERDEKYRRKISMAADIMVSPTTSGNWRDVLIVVLASHSRKLEAATEEQCEALYELMLRCCEGIDNEWKGREIMNQCFELTSDEWGPFLAFLNSEHIETIPPSEITNPAKRARLVQQAIVLFRERATGRGA